MCCLRYLTFTGGSAAVSLTKGKAYDLRFLSDKIMICLPRLVDPVVEMPYLDVETVEVSGPGPVGTPPGELLAWIAVPGLLGAFFGFLIFGLVGLLAGAVVLGLVGALMAAASTKTETIVRVRGRDAEFYFMDAGKRPDAVRIELSEPLMAIRSANAGRKAGGSDPPTELPPGSIPDQLSKLASLLQQGLITRDEFERLKAKVISEG